MMTLRLRTGYELFSDSQGFLLEEATFPGSPRNVGVSVTIQTVERSMVINPTFTLQQYAVQELFDQLWAQGYRPKDGTGNGGHVEALKYHLEDIRKLVFTPGIKKALET
jgi:hypothetical protein